MAQVGTPAHTSYEVEEPAGARGWSLLTTWSLILAYVLLIAGIYWSSGWAWW